MSTVKWYEDSLVDDTPVISSRVRLARNLKNYPFFMMLKEEDSHKMIKEVIDSIKKPETSINSEFEYVDLTQKNDIDKLAMLEKHKISLELLRSKAPRGILLKQDESVDIMINEEDHIRIQSIASGKNIKQAWKTAEYIDNIIEESVEYAFDEDFGYLTSCPSNTGTGMRASYMVHLPMIEASGRLSRIVSALSTFGMTIRGIYGESSESIGNVYQISNQVTLGKSEEEIIENIENITNQIVDNELDVLDNNIKQRPIYFEDQVYRAYAVLSNCRQISIKEAMNLLSTVRIGYMSGVLKEKKPNKSIYNIMMDIEYGNLQLHVGRTLNDVEIDIARAKYIRGLLKAE